MTNDKEYRANKEPTLLRKQPQKSLSFLFFLFFNISKQTKNNKKSTYEELRTKSFLFNEKQAKNNKTSTYEETKNYKPISTKPPSLPQQTQRQAPCPAPATSILAPGHEHPDARVVPLLLCARSWYDCLFVFCCLVGVCCRLFAVCLFGWCLLSLFACLFVCGFLNSFACV